MTTGFLLARSSCWTCMSVNRWRSGPWRP